MTYTTFVQKIKNSIEAKGLKQRAVAERAGYSSTEFSNMLNGRKTIKAEDVLPIAEALGLTPNDLLMDRSKNQDAS